MDGFAAGYSQNFVRIFTKAKPEGNKFCDPNSDKTKSEELAGDKVTQRS